MLELYSITILISIIIFTLSATTSPGPNNIMLLSSGLTYGYRRTLPHMYGIIIGFPLMVLLVGLGLGFVFEEFPIILEVLKVLGIIYLLYLAYKISKNKDTYDIKNKSKPFTFIEAALFQWLNPKAWIMAITAISVFVNTSNNTFLQVVVVSLIFMFASIISSCTWTMGGVLIKKFIKSENAISKMNLIMASLLVLSILPIILE